MPRAIIVATGDLENLPAEIQTVANELSAAQWTVRLCIGKDASRAGLLDAAGEGHAHLVWFGLHSGADGFELADGAWPASHAGIWLRNIGAQDVVLNSCYSIEHAEAIQSSANANLAVAIDPAGVDDALAWQVGVYAVRAYIATRDLQSAVRQASGRGSVQYRYIPCGGRQTGSDDMQSEERIEAQLTSLLRAVRGDPDNGFQGLVTRVNTIQSQLTTLTEEQRALGNEQRAYAAEQRLWRLETERRLTLLEQKAPPVVPARITIALTIAVVALSLILLFVLMHMGAVL